MRTGDERTSSVVYVLTRVEVVRAVVVAVNVSSLGRPPTTSHLSANLTVENVLVTRR